MVFMTGKGGLAGHAAHLEAVKTLRDKKLPKVEIPENGAICHECARALGGKWPRGHCATQWTGTCQVCKGYPIRCCDVGDWNWPDKQARGMRD